MDNTPGPDNDPFDHKTEAFLAWLQQRPGVSISPKIQIADLRHIGAGRGIGMLDRVPLFPSLLLTPP